MKIYTKTGDKGETSLLGGSRVSKDSIRITICGEIDELNAFVGFAMVKSRAYEDILNLYRTIYLQSVPI